MSFLIVSKIRKMPRVCVALFNKAKIYLIKYLHVYLKHCKMWDSASFMCSAVLSTCCKYLLWLPSR